MADPQTTGLSFELHPSDHPLPAAERAQRMADPGFGSVFTDHMTTARWSAGQGWHDARLEPYGPVVLDPASAVFHYGQEIFEGLKAYRQPGQDRVVAFRPEANAARFSKSAARLAMPSLPPGAFTEAIATLVRQDLDWVPGADGHSLYLRPFMIATQRGLGVNHPSDSYLFSVIACPVAGYFGAATAVTVWLSDDYTRAAPGGTGEAKCGGNYAAAFAGQQEAVDRGCDQVVWLDAAERRWVEEMGGMNLFFVYGSGADARLMTPAPTGSLLHGITRDSLLRLAPDLGLPASEGKISVEEWQAGCASGEITEVFACGTAAVITPVGAVRSKRGDWTIGDGTPGPVTIRLREELVGIQTGTKPDPYGWVHPLS